MWRFLLVASLGLLLGACSEPIDRNLTVECDNLDKAGSEYFEDEVLGQFFDVHCTVCHSQDLPEGQGPGTRRGASRSWNYDTHEGAGYLPRATWARIADRTMPPMGREVNEAEENLIYDWLNCVATLQGLEAADDDDSSR
jgi:cytochrome c5